MSFNIFNRICNKKIYDTKKKYNYEEYYNGCISNITIPFDVIEKITKSVNMNDTDNQKNYKNIITHIDSLNHFKMSYKIYKEEILNLRVITVKSDIVVRFDLWF